MTSTLKTLAGAALWLTGGVILLATICFAVLLLVYGELGAGIVFLGLALLQAVVLAALWFRPSRRNKAGRTPLSPAE